ncbi:hypothetical protein SLS63_002871 [Diaporthe eres]|uniref:High-affinity nicotinic acid transporter n=1 Tax=Diaporthe eres TaxID=83184 RepID=A0ABR1PHQ5_DIAER
MSSKIISEGTTSPVDHSSSNSSTTDREQDDHHTHAAHLKSAHRKVDRRLVLWYSFVYLIMRIHVSNISNTAIINLEEGDGIKAQLGNLTSQQWAWVLSVFYYPYMLLEPFATLALKRFTPRLWMSRIMVTWGIVSMCQGATSNYAGILACRFFLGAAEAGFYPGVLLSSMHPETAAFLSEPEKEAIVADLPSRAPSMQSKTFDLDQIKAMFKNPTLVPFLIIWITHGIGGFGITFVLPTVIYELGISDTAISQLMTMPAYAAVFLILLTLGYLTHTKRLSPWVAGIGLEVAQIIFYILLITINNATAKYIFVVIATAATQSFFPIIWPERIRATSGTTSAGLAIGITNGVTQLMGIVGPQVYQPKFGPSYRDKRAEATAVVEGEGVGLAGEKNQAKQQGC